MKNYDLNKIIEWRFKDQFIFVSIISIIFIALFFVYSVNSFKNNSVRYNINIQHKLDEYRDVLSKSVELSNLLKIYHSQFGFDHTNKSQSDEDRINSITNKILNFSEQIDLKITSFENQGLNKNQPFNFYMIRLSMAGTYDQIASFVSNIANMTELIEVEKLFIKFNEFNSLNNLDSDRSDQNLDKLTGDLSLKIYEINI